MGKPGTSLTTFAGASNGAPVAARAHPAGGKDGKSHLATTTITKFKQTSTLACARKLTSNTTLLSQLTGYSTSEDEETNDARVQQKPIDCKNRKAKITRRKAKSTVLVESEGESDMPKDDPLPSISHHRRPTLAKFSRHQLPSITQGTPLAEKACSSEEPTKSRKRWSAEDQSGKTSFPKTKPKTRGTSQNHRPEGSRKKTGGATMKKRAASPLIPRAGAKRPKIVGGFICESDEDSGSDNEVELVTEHDNSSGGAFPFEQKEAKSEDEDDDGESVPAYPPLKPMSLDNRKVAKQGPCPTQGSLERIREKLRDKERELRINRSVPSDDLKNNSAAKQTQPTSQSARDPALGSSIAPKGDAPPPVRRVLGYHAGSSRSKLQTGAKATPATSQSSTSQANAAPLQANKPTSTSKLPSKLSSTPSKVAENISGPSPNRVASAAKIGLPKPAPKKPGLTAASNGVPSKDAGHAAKLGFTKPPPKKPAVPADSNTELSTGCASAAKGHPLQQPAYKAIAATNGNGAHPSPGRGKRTTQNEASNVRPQNIPQTSGHANILGAIIHDIRQTEKPSGAAAKQKPILAAPRLSNPRSNRQTQKLSPMMDVGFRAHSVQKTLTKGAEEASRRQTVSAQASSGTQKIATVGEIGSTDKCISLQVSNVPSPSKTTPTKGQNNSTTALKPRTSPETPRSQKRKAASIEGDVDEALPPSKKHDAVARESSFTIQATAVGQKKSSLNRDANPQIKAGLQAKDITSQRPTVATLRHSSTKVHEKASAPIHTSTDSVLARQTTVKQTTSSPKEQRQVQTTKDASTPAKKIPVASNQKATSPTVIVAQAEKPAPAPISKPDTTRRSAVSVNMPARKVPTTAITPAKESAPSWSFKSVPQQDTEKSHSNEPVQDLTPLRSIAPPLSDISKTVQSPAPNESLDDGSLRLNTKLTPSAPPRKGTNLEKVTLPKKVTPPEDVTSPDKATSPEKDTSSEKVASPEKDTSPKKNTCPEKDVPRENDALHGIDTPLRKEAPSEEDAPVRKQAPSGKDTPPGKGTPLVERRRITPTNISGVRSTSFTATTYTPTTARKSSSTAIIHDDTSSSSGTISTTTQPSNDGKTVAASGEFHPTRQQKVQKGKKKFTGVDGVVNNARSGAEKPPSNQPKLLTTAPSMKVSPLKKEAQKQPATLTSLFREATREPSQPETSLEEQSMPVVILSTTRTLPKDAEPYFEYSIHQKVWLESQSEDSVVATELSSHQYTNIDEANAQAETLFRNAREQYEQHFQVQCDDWGVKSGLHDCKVVIGKFAPMMYPNRKSWMKMCVQRDYVSALAGGVAKEMKHTSFVSKHAYVLRLFELVSPVIADDAEDTEESGPPLRVYCPVEGAECYTTLDAAHRAAKHLQIELSHEKIPKGATETKWQKTEVQQLNDFVRNLREVKDGEERFWESEFNGTGLGSKKFQLVVEKVNMCGPRNL